MARILAEVMFKLQGGLRKSILVPGDRQSGFRPELLAGSAGQRIHILRLYLNSGALPHIGPSGWDPIQKSDERPRGEHN